MKKVFILLAALVIISNAFGVGYSLISSTYRPKGNDTIPVLSRPENQTTSINSNSLAKNSAVTIYPNPAGSDKLAIKADVEIYSVEILNAIGQAVIKQKISSPAKEVTINIPDLRAGMYMTKISFKEKFIVKKLLVK